MAPADLNERAAVDFFRLGLHYYIAGRFATLAGLFPGALAVVLRKLKRAATFTLRSLGPRKSPIPVPETPLTFHRHARRNAFRRREA